MGRLCVRNPKALTNVNINKPTPTKRTAMPETAILSLKRLSILLHSKIYPTRKDILNLPTEETLSLLHIKKTNPNTQDKPTSSHPSNHKPETYLDHIVDPR